MRTIVLVFAALIVLALSSTARAQYAVHNPYAAYEAYQYRPYYYGGYAPYYGGYDYATARELRLLRYELEDQGLRRRWERWR
jgi:hypothetical protein